jgi:hypothetical protein
MSAVRAAAPEAPATAESRSPGAAWSLRDGDRVVFLGDTFVEREGDRGFIETALVAAHPQASLTFRNLGWSGDTVWAESRGVFDQPAKGYARMLDLVRELKPTIVFVAYGRNESDQGEAGLADFRGQLAKLCGRDAHFHVFGRLGVLIGRVAWVDTAHGQHHYARLIEREAVGRFSQGAAHRDIAANLLRDQFSCGCSLF